MAEKIEEIRIIPMVESDLPELIKWAEDEKTLIQWCGPVFDFPLTIEQLQVYFSETKKKHPSRYILKSVINQNIMCGMCELGNVDRRNGTASLCRVFVDTNFRGKGIAEQIISYVINFAFNELDLRRIELNVYTYNTPAYKCYEKLGFVREGVQPG